MIDEMNVRLAKYRLEQARECLFAAKENMKISLKASANRSYYSIFNVMRAALALDAFDSRKHSGVISEFRRRHIKTNRLPIILSDFIGKAFYYRNRSDYEDFYLIDESSVRQQLENAKAFLEEVGEYVNKILEANT